METIHEMLPEDEIFLCGAVLLFGIILGFLIRLVAAWRERRTA